MGNIWRFFIHGGQDYEIEGVGERKEMRIENIPLKDTPLVAYFLEPSFTSSRYWYLSNHPTSCESSI